MKTIGFVFIALFVLASCDSPEAGFRGVERNGIYNETGLLAEWPDEGPELLWEYEGLGRGFASPAVTDKAIYVNGESEGKSFTMALAPDGALLWKSDNGDEFVGEGFSSTYPGARSTPTVKDKMVYATSGLGHLSCFEAASGKLMWSTDLMKDQGGVLGYFGYSESVAVDDEKVYCFPGGLSNNLIALDRETGEIAWTNSVKQDTFAYGSVVMVDLPEAEVLIGTSRHYIYCVSRTNGELLAEYELEGYEYDGEHCNTPVYENGHIYFVANDIPGQGSMKLSISDDGRKIQEKWRNSEVLNNFGGFVVLDGDVFTTIKGNRLLKIDGESGVVSDSLKVGTGAIVFADNKFFCYGYGGNVQLVSYLEGELKDGGMLKVSHGSGQHFSHPVLHNGVLYLRRGNSLMAYGVN